LLTAKVRIFYEMKRIQFNYHCPEELIAQEPAEWDDTINYEIVTRIGAHLKRKII
jgi:alanine racemase